MSLRSGIGRVYDLLDTPRQAMLCWRLRDERASARFARLRTRYTEICRQLIESWDIPAAANHASLFDWPSWSTTIFTSFRQGIPPRFLCHPDLARTMVYGGDWGGRLCRRRACFVSHVFGEQETRSLLREDTIGGPRISGPRWLTSANRTHHAGHLASYHRACNRDFAALDSIVEWGGGYGDMARLVRRRNPNCTYTILDLPELLALQHVYLAAILGEDSVHLVTPEASPQRGKINFLPSSAVAAGKIGVTCAGFLSTWGLNESPTELQRFAAECDFFGASAVLLGYAKNEDNHLLRFLSRLHIDEYLDPFLPPDCAYAFR